MVNTSISGKKDGASGPGNESAVGENTRRERDVEYESSAEPPYKLNRPLSSFFR